ncbi:patatin-like phospholipase family protein [Nostoc sphaeroides CHAB 2801]|uniref:patatin-like phospholipase family protein n=1 Tax=Nostoc sphaeroides TaxID=446679 RepID=UPI000E51900C|nr:patatin-like phospholipase family protein [Nostoc sphaeroides]MCC5634062.1 patatin-like phospholipase family protein [Nostoc sphaeroides CHAB 2801]
MSYKVKVLSIDGGGIRGIIPAIVLNEIEKITQKPIYQLFDLIAGTSTGGILALGLTSSDPDNPGQPFTSEKLIDLYKKQGEVIFKRRQRTSKPILKFLLKQFGLPVTEPQDLFSSKYTSQLKRQTLESYFSKTTYIRDALTEVVITSYDTVLRRPIFFTSNVKKEKKAENYYKICKGCTVFDAAMATSAAPTFFKPYQLSVPNDKKTYILIDGGIFANNPTTLAIIEAMVSYHIKTGERLKLDEILVVSLGTGLQIREFLYKDISEWGILQWTQPFINMALDGQSEVVACQLEQLLSISNLQPKQYYRFQPSMSERIDYVPQQPKEDMDDSTQENITALEGLANKLIDIIKDDLKELSIQLLS